MPKNTCLHSLQKNNANVNMKIGFGQVKEFSEKQKEKMK